jgi:hypothetical protein
MRADRFGSKAGRVAVVAALVLGTLALGTTAASAAEMTSGEPSATVGQIAQTAVSDLAQTNGSDWS